jgi:hypothetical protein
MRSQLRVMHLERGSPGTLRLDSYRRREEAQLAEQRTIKRRLQRGYSPRECR